MYIYVIHVLQEYFSPLSRLKSGLTFPGRWTAEGGRPHIKPIST